jgi:type VII secretion-associated serine protease mycosin
MRSQILLLLAASLAGCGTLSAQGPGRTVVKAANVRQAAFDPSRVIVRLRGGIQHQNALARRFGLQAVTTLNALDASVYKVPTGQSARNLIDRLASDPDVVYAEPDYWVHASNTHHATPQLMQGGADPELGRQWGLSRIDAPKAWTLTAGSPSVIVAVLDTGVDLNHPDLRANLVPGTTFFPEQGGPQDFEGHGTHVSGIIAGVRNNGLGGCGVAPGCKVMPIKVMGPKGPEGKVEFVAAGLVWAVDHGAKVVNLSLGDEGTSNLLRDAVAYAEAKDVVLVAAAGNFDPSKHKTTNTLDYPAGYTGVMAVGATDPTDKLADFSFWGPWISVVAPGVNIYSTVPGDETSADSGRYREDDGTSMAAPFVAGVAALVRSRFPGMRAIDVKRRIEASATLPADANGHMGHGLINAYKALADE